MKIKKQFFLTAILVVIGLVISSVTGSFDDVSESKEEVVSVLVYLKDQVDLDKITTQMNEQGATLRDRHETTVVALQNTAYKSQPQLVEYLNELQSEDLVKDFRCFWISNIILVNAYHSIIDRIAMRDDVLTVYPNYEIELVEPIDIVESDYGYIDGVEPGVVAIRAPEVWEEFNITGEGVLVATIDTGVDGYHPALASRWAGVADPRYEGHPEWAWFDSYSYQNDFPFDHSDHGHGTHTMGTVCGGAPGRQIGVAPGAFWISSGWKYKNVSQFTSDIIETFEWMIDPDGDPTTNWDVPDVCSNSWGLTDSYGIPPCDETFWSFLDACEAAGTVIIFIAGNEGYYGLRRPADRATDDYRCFAVAAVDANDPSWPIANFSSRGPTYCTPNGTKAIKPDIAGPGVDILSSVPGGFYTKYSGTSMAAPHINGVVALMRQANPNIGVEDIKEIIFQTAYDLGNPGEDNDYGWGMIDAYEAVLEAIHLFNPPPENPQKPSGETEGVINIEYTYSSSTTDPEGQQILYMFDWGDNTTSDWLGPYESGETVNATHAWEEKGDYEIKVKAKDINHSVSEWSEPLTVTIVQGPLLDILTIRGGFFKVKTTICNIGAAEATNVDWVITLEGGKILRGRTTTGTIPSIPPQDGVQIFSDPIIGWGDIKVIVTAEIPESTDSRDQTGKVFIIYIKVDPGGD